MCVGSFWQIFSGAKRSCSKRTRTLPSSRSILFGEREREKIRSHRLLDGVQIGIRCARRISRTPSSELAPLRTRRCSLSLRTRSQEISRSGKPSHYPGKRLPAGGDLGIRRISLPDRIQLLRAPVHFQTSQRAREVKRAEACRYSTISNCRQEIASGCMLSRSHVT